MNIGAGEDYLNISVEIPLEMLVSLVVEDKLKVSCM